MNKLATSVDIGHANYSTLIDKPEDKKLENE